MSDQATKPEDPKDDGQEGRQTPADRYNYFVQQLNERESEITSMLPSNVSPAKFRNAALSAVKRDPMILNASPRSLFVAITQAAQDGLLPDGKEGVINVYKGEAKWNAMTAGIRKRARELDRLIIDAQVVYKNDKFVWKQGDNPAIEHEPAQLGTPRGEMIGAYAVFKREDGDILHREVMDKAQIMDVKSISKNQDSLLWVKFETEGWRKSVVRRGIKTVPSSEGLMQIVTRNDDNFVFDTPEPRAALKPPPAPPPAPKMVENKPGATLDVPPAKPKERLVVGGHDVTDKMPLTVAELAKQRAAMQAGPEVQQADTAADDQYADWLKEAYAELSQCLNEPAVDEIRERILPDLKVGDIQTWKDAAAERATAVFNGKKK